MVKTVLAAIVLAALAAAQNTGAVDGMVVNRVSGAGIPNVKVVVYTRQAVRYFATSDATGAFHTTNMAPGTYEIELQEEIPSFLPSQPRGIGPVQGAVRYRLELTPVVNVSGRVVDSDGKPVANATAKLLRGGTTQTDQEGKFAFPGIQPGSYQVSAIPKTTKAAPGVAVPVLTYYPSSLTEAGAELVSVRGDADVTGVEIRLQTSEVFSIRGVVLDAAGAPQRNADVQLMPVVARDTRVIMNTNNEYFLLGGPGLEPGTMEATVRSGDDGTFEFAAVRPGDWHLDASVAGSIDSPNYAQSIRVGGATVSLGRHDEEVRISLGGPFKVTGTVEWNDSRVRNAGVGLATAEGRRNVLPLPSPASASGSFNLNVVGPGKYFITPGYSPASDGSYPAAVYLGGQQVFGQAVELLPGSPPIRVVYKTDAGHISGTVENGDGASVALIPQQVQRIGFGRIARCGPGGTFDIKGVPPGEYYVAAVTGLDYNTAIQPDVLMKLVAAGTRIRVGPSSDQSLQLRILR